MRASSYTFPGGGQVHPNKLARSTLTVATAGTVTSRGPVPPETDLKTFP